jgi:HEPN domain-containing protein
VLGGGRRRQKGEKMATFFERWGFEQTSEAKWKAFISRLFMLIGNGSSKLELTVADLQLIAYKLGVMTEEIGTTDSMRISGYLHLSSLINVHMQPSEIARNLESLIDLVPESRQEVIKNLVNNSQCGFNILKSDKVWTTFPEGEKLLDQKLVEEPLSFLVNKPAKEFKNALIDYSNNKSVEAAEKSRRALEEYIRQVLDRPKIGLEEGIKQYGKKIKEDGVPEHIRNLIIKDLNLLNGHYNDSSKHQSETKIYEAEYLIYNVGALIRMMDNIRRLSVSPEN